jgi:hypothetical protein
MFGNINKTNKNDTSRRDMSENSHSSRGKTNVFIKPNYSIRSNRYDSRNNKTSNNRYDEATYSVSSEEEESDESQRFLNNKKQIVNKTPRINELEFVKKENIELKLKIEHLTKLNNLSESILKTSNLMIDICNEQKLINSRLDKLENEPKPMNQKLVDHTILNNHPVNTILNDDILPIGDDSSHSILSMENNKSQVDDIKLSLLPKIADKK